MGRTAIAWGSASAHNLAAYSQSEQGFATNFNMYPEVQLPPPNGSLGHTRGPMNCAMARSKALINAGMPVYFVWNKKSYISNGTEKSVGSDSVSNTRCHGISVQGWKQRPGSPDSPAGQNLAFARFWPGFPGFPGFWSWIPPVFSPGCRQSWIIIRESGVVSNPVSVDDVPKLRTCMLGPRTALYRV